MWIFTFISIALIQTAFSVTTQCDLRLTSYGSVCVCNDSYCDYLDMPKLQSNESIIVISSSKKGLRFSVNENGVFGSNEVLTINDFPEAKLFSSENYMPSALVIEDDGSRAFLHVDDDDTKSRVFFGPFNNRRVTANLHVDRNKDYQKIVGFGGAFTGAVSYLLEKLSPNLQDHIYKSYFDASGIAYNMLRMSIGGCDFDLAPWAYNELPRDDTSLTNFTKLDNRDEMKIQQINRLKNITNLKDLKIMAAAWSAPIWMKSNNDWTGFSYLKSQYYQTWADYHLKFLELMASKNMPIWAISTGNEPLNGIIAFIFVHFMSMGWTASNQAIWLSEYLGPTIKNSKHKDVLIFGNDDQRITYPEWFRAMKRSRKNALDYLDGLAVHWYWDELSPPSLIDAAHKDMPEKLLFNTESCIGDKPWQTHGPELGSWERAEQYIRSFMQDLQHEFNGYIDWNIILNEEGGPNYVRNFVDSAVIVNETSGKEFYKQPIFYGIGHFTKFIPANSVRISAQESSLHLDAVAFRRLDNSIAVILHNSDRAPMEISLTDSIRGKFIVNIPARSIHTFVYN